MERRETTVCKIQVRSGMLQQESLQRCEPLMKPCSEFSLVSLLREGLLVFANVFLYFVFVW